MASHQVEPGQVDQQAAPQLVEHHPLEHPQRDRQVASHQVEPGQVDQRAAPQLVEHHLAEQELHAHNIHPMTGPDQVHHLLGTAGRQANPNLPTPQVQVLVDVDQAHQQATRSPMHQARVGDPHMIDLQAGQSLHLHKVGEITYLRQVRRPVRDLHLLENRKVQAGLGGPPQAARRMQNRGQRNFDGLPQVAQHILRLHQRTIDGPLLVVQHMSSQTRMVRANLKTLRGTVGRSNFQELVLARMQEVLALADLAVLFRRLVLPADHLPPVVLLTVCLFLVLIDLTVLDQLVVALLILLVDLIALDRVKIDMGQPVVTTRAKLTVLMQIRADLQQTSFLASSPQVLVGLPSLGNLRILNLRFLNRELADPLQRIQYQVHPIVVAPHLAVLNLRAHEAAAHKYPLEVQDRRQHLRMLVRHDPLLLYVQPLDQRRILLSLQVQIHPKLGALVHQPLFVIAWRILSRNQRALIPLQQLPALPKPVSSVVLRGHVLRRPQGQEIPDRKWRKLLRLILVGQLEQISLNQLPLEQVALSQVVTHRVPQPVHLDLV